MNQVTNHKKIKLHVICRCFLASQHDSKMGIFLADLGNNSLISFVQFSKKSFIQNLENKYYHKILYFHSKFMKSCIQKLGKKIIAYLSFTSFTILIKGETFQFPRGSYPFKNYPPLFVSSLFKNVSYHVYSDQPSKTFL